MITPEQAVEYLRFLDGELQRYKTDLYLDDDELSRFAAELKKFQERIEYSDHIPTDMKEACLALHFDRPTQFDTFKKSWWQGILV